MATERGSETENDKAALIETTTEQDSNPQPGTISKNEKSKLTLYHWTQSFNSQKVSLSAPLVRGQLPRTGTDLVTSSTLCPNFIYRINILIHDF